MKRLFQFSLSLLILSLFIFAGCNPSQKKTAKNNTKKLEETNAFNLTSVKDEIVDLVVELSKSEDIVPMLNEAGASYIFDLTVPLENVEKMLTQSQMSFFWGMVVFDMFYANVYKRDDVLLSVSEMEYKFKMDLGLEKELAKLERYNKRIKTNEGNPDSIKAIIDESSDEWFADMSSNHLDILVYSFIGNNVEALYVLTQLTLLANNNAELLTIINEQKGHISTLFSLLELVSQDENIEPYFDDLEKVAKLFEEKTVITETELAEITPLIETVRNKMMN
ncbi:MAG: hypothetical protein PF541_15910 [Prolixibacteraceae bacterium]|jgi:hypothetical protein|nr:hypothetical protein [Prolixibacteraceae bacterium]